MTTDQNNEVMNDLRRYSSSLCSLLSKARSLQLTAYLQRHEQRVDGNRFELRHNDTLFSMNSQWSAGFDYSVNQQKLYAKGRPRRMRS